MKFLKVFIVSVLLLLIGYLVGPSTSFDYSPKALPQVPSNLFDLESYVRNQESKEKYLKPDNEGRIVWADSIPTKTSYCLLYLPGYSATYYEAEPMHRDIAKRYGWNLYLPRLYAHGIAPPEPFLEMTAEKYLASAREALAVASAMADSVIIMSTSTGGTLSLILESEANPQIAGLILLSPNISIYNSASKLLDKPWGLQIARLVYGSNYHEWKAKKEYINDYWTTKYRLEGIVQLQCLISACMNENTFSKVKVPTYLGYYYNNEELQDKTVSVDAMKQMFALLGTIKAKKVQYAFKNAGAHVIADPKQSAAVSEIKSTINQFIESQFIIR